MADILICFGGRISLDNLRSRLITTHRAHSIVGASGALVYAVSRVDEAAMWYPARDLVSGRIVLVSGRIALTAAEWDAAERLPFEGGLAARHLLSHWGKCAGGHIPEFNGASIAVFVDPLTNQTKIRTDRIGCAPIYASTGTLPLVIGSHPDSVAAVLRDQGMAAEIDDATVAEFVRTGTAIHPYTYYKGIVQLDPGAIYTITEAGISHRETYWRPTTAEGGAPVSRPEFVDRLADGLRAAGRLRSSYRMGTTAVLLSAGADSRGVVAALAEPQRTHTYTYYDEPNPELSRAKQIANLIGAPHHALARPSDYYIVNAEETVRLSGGMWSLESGHHTGFVDEIWKTPGFGTLLTGCYADYLLKGISLNVRPKMLMGIALPLSELAPIEQEFHHPLTQVALIHEKESSERWRRRFGEVIDRENRYQLEYLRNAPLCREADASGRLALWRQFPIDPIMADTHVLDAVSVQSIPDKLSGIAFGLGIAKVTGAKVAKIPNNNYSAPVGTHERGRVIAFAAASLKRKFDNRLRNSAAFTPRGVGTYGSWPNFHLVFGPSEQARAWFDSLKSHDFYGILTSERSAWDYDTFVSRDIVQLMRLLTVQIWRARFAVAPTASRRV